jgi:hypothetical protein
VNEDLPCVGICIKTDNILLLKIENDTCIINERDFLMLDQGSGNRSRIKIFKMSGSLKEPGPEIGQAIKTKSGYGIVFFVHKKVFTAPLSCIKAVLLGYYPESPIQYIGPIKPHFVYVGDPDLFYDPLDNGGPTYYPPSENDCGQNQDCHDYCEYVNDNIDMFR